MSWLALTGLLACGRQTSRIAPAPASVAPPPASTRGAPSKPPTPIVATNITELEGGGSYLGARVVRFSPDPTELARACYVEALATEPHAAGYVEVELRPRYDGPSETKVTGGSNLPPALVMCIARRLTELQLPQGVTIVPVVVYVSLDVDPSAHHP